MAYNPQLSTPASKPIALSNGGPDSARSMFYDSVNFIYRDFNGKEEVISEYPLAKDRTGRPVYFVNEGGVLNNNGTYTGGKLVEYWFKDGVADTDLVVKANDSLFISARRFGAVLNDATDDTVKIQAAIDYVNVNNGVLVLDGFAGIAGTINLPTRMKISGTDRRHCGFRFLNNNAKINIVGLQGSIRESVEFSGVSFNGDGFQALPHIFSDWAKFLNFTDCFFYHCASSHNHSLGPIYYNNCEGFDSPMAVHYTQDFGPEGNTLSTGPKFINCYFSNCPLFLEDVTDTYILNTHFFAGPYGVLQKFNYFNHVFEPNTVIKTGIYISNSIFDSIDGIPIELEDIAWLGINNSFISGGRVNNKQGMVLRRCINGSVNATFHFNGDVGLDLVQCNHLTISSSFSGNKGSGLRLGSCENISIVGSQFGTKDNVYGGYYIMPTGIEDVTSDAKNVTVVGCSFDDALATKIYLPISGTNGNRVVACNGVRDQLDRANTTEINAIPTATLDLAYKIYDTVLERWKFWNGTAFKIMVSEDDIDKAKYGYIAGNYVLTSADNYKTLFHTGTGTITKDVTFVNKMKVTLVKKDSNVVIIGFAVEPYGTNAGTALDGTNSSVTLIQTSTVTERIGNLTSTA